MESFKTQFEVVYALTDRASVLRKKFEITESKPWNITKSVMELGVQIGHLVTVILKTKDDPLITIVQEADRLLNRVEDEIADCIFQILCILYRFDSHCIHSEVKHFEINHRKFELLEIIQLVSFPTIIFGQIVESLMKINQLRFPRNRVSSEQSFFISRLVQLISIIIHISNKYKVNLKQSFIDMKMDAEKFLSTYKEYSEKQAASKAELKVLNHFFNT